MDLMVTPEEDTFGHKHKKWVHSKVEGMEKLIN